MVLRELARLFQGRVVFVDLDLLVAAGPLAKRLIQQIASKDGAHIFITIPGGPHGSWNGLLNDFAVRRMTHYADHAGASPYGGAGRQHGSARHSLAAGD